MTRIIILAASALPLATMSALTALPGVDEVVVRIGEEGAAPAPAPAPERSTRGHKVGDAVRYDRKGEDPIYGRVVGLENGHAVVQFDGIRHRNVMVGATMDDLVVIDEPQKATDGAPPEVAGKDARFDPLTSAQEMLEAVSDGDVVAVALAGITSTGAVRLYASESSGQTLNLLAQAIRVADGTLAADD